MTALRIAVFAVLFGILGYALAQFFPLFSDPLTKNICQPFSPCRDSAVPGYVVGGVILGMLFGLLNDILVKQSAARKS